MTRAAISGRLDIDRPTYDDLIAHARADFPYEVCGLLACAGGKVTRRYRIANAARSMTFYTMDSMALLHAMNDMDDHAWELGVIYHSHTHTEAFPSPTDVDLAAYPEAVYVIVSLQDPEHPVLRAFDIVDRRITERVLTVDGEEAATGRR